MLPEGVPLEAQVQLWKAIVLSQVMARITFLTPLQTVLLQLDVNKSLLSTVGGKL